MADVASNLYSWSTTESSNSPSGTTVIGGGLDDNLRMLQTVVRQDLANKGADIASAATTDLGAVIGLMHDITGTTTITSLGTVSAGIWKIIKFEGALTLTHNATSLILPGGANITTADGDIAVVISEGSGNWRCVSYTRTASEPLAFTTQAIQEAATSNVVAVTPGRQHFHPAVPKAWGMITPATTVSASYPSGGVSVVQNGTGDFTVTHGVTFSSTSYCVIATANLNTTRAIAQLKAAKTATTFRVLISDDAGNPVDPTTFDYLCLGDL